MSPHPAVSAVAPTSSSKPAAEEEIQQLDQIFQLMSKNTPPEPYIVTVPSDKPYILPDGYRDNWRRGTNFDRAEEHLQYCSFLWRDTTDSLFVLSSQREDETSFASQLKAPASTPGTPLLSSQGGPKKKISLAAYKSKTQQNSASGTPVGQLHSEQLKDAEPNQPTDASNTDIVPGSASAKHDSEPPRKKHKGSDELLRVGSASPRDHENKTTPSALEQPRPRNSAEESNQGSNGIGPLQERAASQNASTTPEPMRVTEQRDKSSNAKSELQNNNNPSPRMLKVEKRESDSKEAYSRPQRKHDSGAVSNNDNFAPKLSWFAQDSLGSSRSPLPDHLSPHHPASKVSPSPEALRSSAAQSSANLLPSLIARVPSNIESREKSQYPQRSASAKSQPSERPGRVTKLKYGDSQSEAVAHIMQPSSKSNALSRSAARADPPNDVLRRRKAEINGSTPEDRESKRRHTASSSLQAHERAAKRSGLTEIKQEDSQPADPQTPSHVRTSTSSNAVVKTPETSLTKASAQLSTPRAKSLKANGVNAEAKTPTGNSTTPQAEISSSADDSPKRWLGEQRNFEELGKMLKRKSQAGWTKYEEAVAESSAQTTSQKGARLSVLHGIESILCFVQAFCCADQYSSSPEPWRSLGGVLKQVTSWAKTLQLPHLQGLCLLCHSMCYARMVSIQSMQPWDAFKLDGQRQQHWSTLGRWVQQSELLGKEADVHLSRSVLRQDYAKALKASDSMALAGAGVKPMAVVRTAMRLMEEWSGREDVDWTPQLREGMCHRL